MGFEIKGVEISGRTVCTAANAMDVVATVATFDGIRRGLDTWSGIVEVGVAEIEDLGNGPLARSRGEDSDFGAFVDTALDKAKGLAAGIELWRKNLAPKWALGAVAVVNAVNAAASIVAGIRHPEREKVPEKDGKRGLFLQKFGLGMYPIAEKLKERHPRAAKIVRGVGHVSVTTGLILSTKASVSYVRRAI